MKNRLGDGHVLQTEKILWKAVKENIEFLKREVLPLVSSK